MPFYIYHKKNYRMGATGSLYRIKKAELKRIIAKESFYQECEEMVDVDKRWEAIMYILSGGSLGSEPFVSLFMPKNIINPNDNKEWGEPYRYHNEEDIKMYNQRLSEIPEGTILERANVEKINKGGMGYAQREIDRDFIINEIKAIKTLFKNAEINGDLILGMIAY